MAQNNFLFYIEKFKMNIILLSPIVNVCVCVCVSKIMAGINALW